MFCPCLYRIWCLVYFHPSIDFLLSEVRWQQVQKGNPDTLPSNTLQLLLGAPKAFPRQKGYIIHPASSGSALGSPSSRKCPENLLVSSYSGGILIECLLSAWWLPPQVVSPPPAGGVLRVGSCVKRVAGKGGTLGMLIPGTINWLCCKLHALYNREPNESNRDDCSLWKTSDLKLYIHVNS